jgi:hypothetical protein
MEVSSWLTGRRGVTLPFTDFCPPLSVSTGTLPATLWSETVEFGQKRGWRTIEIRGGGAPRHDAQPSNVFYGHHLDLGRGESDLFDALYPSVRRAIRKAQKSGVTIELSHALDALHDYYSLHGQTRRRHGLPPQPFRFFLSLHDEIISTGSGFIALARVDGRAIAGAIFLHAGRMAVFKYGASDAAHQALRANDLLFWETIRRLAADGFGTLHFGRTDLEHEGLRRFKLGWGTREELIHYYRYDLRCNDFVTVQNHVNGRHNVLFARLPVPVNRLLASLLYKHLD